MPSGSHNTHARLAPSDSKRWTNCTAALAYQEANSHRIPKDTGSVYADEGTEAHDWAAKVLMNETPITEVPEGFREPVKDYVDHCLSLVPEGVSYETEVQVPLFYQPDSTGTCDFGIIMDSRITVRDYKHGAGVLVTSVDNTQMAIYGFSLIKLLEDVYDFTDDTVIDFAVFQPRHREGLDQPSWKTTLGELRKFCAEIELRANEAREAVDAVRDKLDCGSKNFSCDEIIKVAPKSVFAPSDGDDGACRWCKCKAFCEARLSAAVSSLPVADPREMLAAMPDLTKEESKLPVKDRVEVVGTYLGLGSPVTEDFLVTLLERGPAIKKFIADVEEYLTERALSGDIPNNMKLVWGRAGNREWVNDEEADTFLTGQKIKADDRYTKKLISPTQAEKLLKGKLKTTRAKNRYEELVTRSSPKKVLAPISDKREAVEPDVGAMPDLTETETE